MRDILTVSEHQEIFVSSKRDVEKNTISYEDRELLFDVIHRDKHNKERSIIATKGKNKIKASSIVGTVSLKTGLTLEILPKFAKNTLDKDSIKKHRKMLLQILRVSHEKNLISSSSQSSKISADEMPLIHYIIERFSEELLYTLRTGMYATYNKKVENSSHIRGNILISKTLQNNIIDKSKVYTSYNKHSSNNLLMQVFRTLAKILLNDNNLSYRAKRTLHEVYLLLDSVDIIPLKQQDFKSITFNRLNDKFEILFRQAEFIFNRYMPFTSHINSTPFWSILFDMNYLFEKFCGYLFRKSDLEIEEQSIKKCFENHKYDVSAKPDFVIKGNKNLFEKEIISVVDAKWKLLTKHKSLYGLDSQNFWQLFSYMNLLNPKEELHGYFIVPKNNENFDDEIIFTPIKEGNKSITILSIDFSLSFEELIERYRFRIIDSQLKLDIMAIENIEEIIPFNEKIKEKVETIEVEKEFKFNFEEFIAELEILYQNPSIIQQLSPTKKDERFKNIFSLKNKSKIITQHLNRVDWILKDLEITVIPRNINKLHNASILNLKNNLLENLPESLFELEKLSDLDISQNFILVIPSKIKNLKKLKKLSIDKEIVDENIELLKELKENKILIKDENNNNLSEYIDSITIINESKNIVDKTNIINPDEIIINDKNNILKDENIHTSMKKTIIITRENTKLKYFKNNISIDENISDYINEIETKKQERIKEAEFQRQRDAEAKRQAELQKQRHAELQKQRHAEAKRQEKIRQKKRLEEEKVKIQEYIKLKRIKNIVIINDLMWETESQKMDWYSALKYAEKLNIHGYSDWRLPTIEELKSIIQNCGGIVNSDKNKANTQYQNCYKNKGFKITDWYWSYNSVSGNIPNAWVVHFSSGSVSSDHHKYSSRYFKCVREILKN